MSERSRGNRFWRRASVFGVVLGLALAACQPGQVGQTPAPGGLVRGGGEELKILYWQAPTILNSHLATGTKDFDASRLVLEPLASWGPEAKPIANGLAAEIPTVANGGVSSDFTTVTWKLRPGVKWSDGTEFTADDVVFTWEFVKDPKTGASTADTWTNLVESVEAKDKNTVTVTYTEPNANFYQFGVGFNMHILQKAQFKDFMGEKAKDAPGNLKPIGTGPYKVSEFRSGDVVIYEMNENFRDPNKPYFKRVQFKGGGDATTAARSVLQTGDFDYAWNLQVEAGVLRQLAQGGRGDLLIAYGNAVERILVNFANPDPALGDNRNEPGTRHPFLSDKAVRRALAMATDRKTVADQLYGAGLIGKETCNIISGVPDFESRNTANADVCKFDLVAAERELEQAGWVKGPDGVRAKGGVRLNILFQTSVNPVRQKTQDIMKANWEKIGFKVELRSVPATTFFTNTAIDGANKFFADVEMFTNSGDPDPTSILTDWTTAELTGKANDWNLGNYHRYSNPEFDRLIENLRRETDPTKRNDLIVRLNDILVTDVVIIPLILRAAVSSAQSKDLKGVVPNGWDSEMYNIADWHK